MFVNENGEIAVIDQEQIIQSLSQNSFPYWIAIPGCNFDIIGKTGEQLENFVQNSFELTFQNITNPIQSEDSSEFLIQIF